MNSDSTTTSKGSILVIDDSPDNLRVLSSTLTRNGYKVRCVTNGEMALIGINRLPTDLILLDIRMPLMDGYEVCRQLKANPNTRDIPVIFLSAADDVAGKVKAFAVGGVDYITKPFQTEEVLARIANQLTIQRLQNQLLERNQRLQQEIDEHKQTEAALQDAKEAAEAANYAKSQFLAKMNHELRTPLNAILGFTELMRGDPALGETYQDYLNTINQSGEHLLKLLNHILAVTSAGADKISLNEHDFDLHHLLNSIASAAQQKASAKGLQLSVECAPIVPRHIRSDESKLRQVLMNLLENAIQFTQQGKGMLRVKVENHRVEELTKQGGTEQPSPRPLIPIVFEVEDTGAGIAAHEMSHLFQVFSQTEVGRKSERGVGLGLFISRQFIRVMGGEITVSSTAGQGTIVRFYILAHLAEPNLELAQSAAASSDRPIVFSFQPPANQPTHLTEERMVEAMQTQMPTEWLTRLHQAATKGFDRQISHLIREIPATHASLARALTYWNQNFQFDQILAITQQVLKQTS
jgi:two-component system, sensor histidine kinase and response regulator